jgi:beta-lactamase regulating signal transducer with metallopeptidase domain
MMDELHLITILAWPKTPAALLEASVKALALLCLAFFLAWLLRRSSAAWRHCLWAGAMTVVLALPLLSLFVPRLEVSPDWLTGSLARGQAAAPIADFFTLPLPAEGFPIYQAMNPETGSGLPVPVEAAAGIPWLTIFGIVWLAGTVFLVLRFYLGIRRLGRVLAGAYPSGDVRFCARLRDLKRELGVKGDVAIYVSPAQRVPLTWGMVRPLILLPEGALRWSESEQDMVLRHELAHVRRRDVLIRHLTLATCALHWFNPLVWLAGSRLRKEQERACDDEVLQAGIQPAAYAEHLLKIVRVCRHDASPGLLAAGMARCSEVEDRIRRIIDFTRRPSPSSRLLVVALLAVGMCLVVPLAGLSLQSEAVVAQDSWTDQEVPEPPPPPPSPDPPGLPGVAPPPPPAAPPAPPLPPAPPRDTGTFSWTRGNQKMQVSMEGVRFGTDHSEIVGISPEGYFIAEELRGSGRRRIEIRSGNGGLQKRFLIDGVPAEWDSRAENFLAENLKFLRERHNLSDRLRRFREQDLAQLEAGLREMQVELERVREEIQEKVQSSMGAFLKSEEFQALQRQAEEIQKQFQQELRPSQAELQALMESIKPQLEAAKAINTKEMERLREEMERFKLDEESLRQIREAAEEAKEQLKRLREELP